ncbi:MAG: sensor histidine kinase [Chloroflexota bacterium]|nr:sensor histidine kinase [Chloroflexota bacterium]
MTTTLPRPARLALLPLGIAFGLGAEVARLAAGWPLVWVVADLLPGIAFLVCGHIAWQRRPENRVGPLMVAIGFAWYVGTYGAIVEPAISETAHAFQGYYDALLAWLILAYPSGRLASRSSRAVVTMFFAVLAVRTAFRLAIIRPSTEYGDLTDPAVADRYVADVALRADGDAVFSAIIALLAIAVVVLVIGRWHDQTAAGRRVAGPILLGGLAFAIGIVVEYATGFVPTTNILDRIALDDLGLYLTVATTTLVPIGFLVGLTRARIARGGVADLVLQLESKPDQPTLREVLAKALGDPSLEVAYAVPGTADFVDVDGRTLEVPEAADPKRAVTRLERDGATIALLIHDPVLMEQPELLGSVSAATRLALDNERLQAEVRAQLEEVRASRARIVAAGDAERRRVERDLHDGAQQRLVTLALALQLAQSQAGRSEPGLPATLDRATNELELALGELRELARGLHPTVLVEDGLGAAVESLADRSPVPVRLIVPDTRFAPDLEATAYFIVAEALTNVAKYAQATQARVDIERRDGVLMVEVVDDGVGGADPGRGSGIRGLDDRVAAAGGRLTLTSRPGEGTTIRADIPCA